jgi:hypothetical protein
MNPYLAILSLGFAAFLAIQEVGRRARAETIAEYHIRRILHRASK